MSQTYYNIHIKEFDDYFMWELIEDAPESHSLVVMQWGLANTIEDAFAAANKERNKYIEMRKIK